MKILLPTQNLDIKSVFEEFRILEYQDHSSILSKVNSENTLGEGTFLVVGLNINFRNELEYFLFSTHGKATQLASIQQSSPLLKILQNKNSDIYNQLISIKVGDKEYFNGLYLLDFLVVSKTSKNCVMNYVNLKKIPENISRKSSLQKFLDVQETVNIMGYEIPVYFYLNDNVNYSGRISSTVTTLMPDQSTNELNIIFNVLRNDFPKELHGGNGTIFKFRQMNIPPQDPNEALKDKLRNDLKSLGNGDNTVIEALIANMFSDISKSK